MEKEILCELCRKPMREIGPFASIKLEGQPAEKDNGKRKFQCLNENCNKYEEIIEINVSNFESYIKRVQRLCKCGHTREMHDYRFSPIESGKLISKGEKDVECKTNDCGCIKYIADLK